jgi:hypothetical protein
LSPVKRPAHELGLAHVGSKRGHDAHMRRVLHEVMQRSVVLPRGESPELLRQRVSENRKAEHALR